MCAALAEAVDFAAAAAVVCDLLSLPVVLCSLLFYLGGCSQLSVCWADAHPLVCPVCSTD